ncbi:MAG: YihY/virulence factor BrkB family protein [Streptosporangiales bacterium]
MPRRLRLVAAVVVSTAVSSFRYRVLGLAAEAAFWALLSLPPLLLGLVGLLGHFRGLVGANTLLAIRAWVLTNASLVLSDHTVDTVVAPLIDEVFRGGSVGVIAASFLVALWAGSRALYVYVLIIAIAYGLSGRRGAIRTRALSCALYLAGLAVSVMLLPLLVAGPAAVKALIPQIAGWVDALYWPVIVVASVAALTSLYTVTVPARVRWLRGLAGAAAAVGIWIVGSYALRAYLGSGYGGSAIYQSLTAPIAILLWLYLTSLAILIGAALNAEIDKRFRPE